MLIFLVSGESPESRTKLAATLAGPDNVFYLGSKRNPTALSDLRTALKTKLVGLGRCAIADILTKQEATFFKESFPRAQHFHISDGTESLSSMLSMELLEIAMAADYACVAV